MIPAELRALSAEGKFDTPTAGFCPGYVQANLAAFPEKYAADFQSFCRLNPKPCPLLEIIGPGSTLSTRLAPGADICTTIPRYIVWQNGIQGEATPSVTSLVAEDFVFFLLGCSFSFEEALIDADIPLRHLEQKKNVAMYRTSIPLQPAGPFQGEMVVSMRPIRKELLDKVVAVTERYPDVHGAPIHAGNPEQIGIKDITLPDYGDTITIEDGELPVFWACGVTPQNVLLNAKLPLAVTHAPGYMFVSDLKNSDFAVK